jgi:hypothetical protein
MFLDEGQQSFSFISSYIDQATIFNLFEHKAIIRTWGITYVFFIKKEGSCLIRASPIRVVYLDIYFDLATGLFSMRSKENCSL